MAATVLIAGALQVPAQLALAADNGFKLPPVQQTQSVAVAAVKPDAAGSAPKSGAATAPAAAAWPRAGRAEVQLLPKALAGNAGPTKVEGLPLTVAPATGQGESGGAPGKVRVELSDRAAAAKLGLDGVLVTVQRADGKADAGRTRVQLDYRGFREAYGGGWSSRLRFVQLPSCALTTPDAAECRTAAPVASTNDAAAGTLSADVDTSGTAKAAGGTVQAAAATAEASTTSGAAQLAPAVLGLVSDAAGPEGDFKATSLSASASWSAGGNSGSFTWSYPIGLPPVPGGLAPKIALGYSSGSIDGKTASTNNQSSWIGDGWQYEPGFIERSYVGCAEDKASGTNAPAATGDLCWKSDNATISLNGNASSLVRDDATGVWKLSSDDGSRVEKLNGNGTDTANGDVDNEYWKVTTLDGTQYFFGKNRLPGWSAGKPETGSALTVPVFGNHPGEPGYAPAFKDSSRDRGWRWQLDYVVDPHGNAVAYFYDQEKNAYTRNIAGVSGTPKANATYTRAATLNRIEYGHRAGQVHAAPPAGKVTFGVGDRCVAADCSFTKANAANWYDTPVDQSCDLNQDCTNSAPSFWSKRRLTGITTEARQADGSYRTVDSWSLAHSFPAVGDNGGRALWLETIKRTTKVGGQEILQPVTFDRGPSPLPNRVDAAEGRPPMYRFRIHGITSETGSRLGIKYRTAECTAGALPAPDYNDKNCYPSWWTPSGAVDPVLDWFHKYPVVEVTEQDLVAGDGSPAKVTGYEYVGGAAWRRDNSEFTLDKHRTWNDFRGYKEVLTRVGSSAKSLTKSVYHRGLDGDVRKDGSARTGDSVGGPDPSEFAGLVRETVVYEGDGGKAVSRTVSTPSTRTTATRGVKALPAKDNKPTTVLPAESGRPEATALPPVLATVVRATGGTTHLFGSDGTTVQRTTRTSSEYDGYGQLTKVSDEGDTAVTGDEQCTTTTYAAPDTANWFIGYPTTVQTTSAVCSTAASPSNVTGETRTSYDGRAPGVAPEQGKGNPTTVEVLERYDGTTPKYVRKALTAYDQYGRATSVKDVNNAETTTAHTPATGSQATTVVTTDPKGYATTTTYDGLRSLPVRVVDANGRTTSVEYDELGRTTGVWNPGRAKPASANATYEYRIETGKTPAVVTRTLLEDGSYRVSTAIFDGLLRPRQTQEEAHGGSQAHNGKRNLTNTFYDSHGRVRLTNAPYWNDAGQPDTTLWVPLDNKAPSQTETEYDGLDRPTATIFKSLNVEKWRTTLRYGPNWTATTPPEGGTAQLTVSDAHGRTTELRHYKNGSPDIAAPATAYETLTYTYNQAGKLSKAVDAAGNTWTWEYDLLGRPTKAVDPDSGTSTKTYNQDGTLATTTDGRGKTLAYSYDVLGRKTGLFEGSPTGTKLADWTYDTLTNGKGMPVASTRYENGKPYSRTVAGYDALGRPTGSSVGIPDTEGGLAGTYTSSQTFTPNTGLVDTTTYPAGGGLAQETLQHNYSPLGLPTTTSAGGQVYASGRSYSPFAQVLQESVGTIGSSTTLTYVYENATQRLGLLQVDKSGAPQTIDRKTYTYNPAGGIVRVRDERDNLAVTDTQCFTYDFARRLTNAWTATDDCVAKPGGGVLPKVGGINPYWTSYTYDAAGNRTQETTRTSGAAAGPLMDTTKVTNVAIAGDNQTTSVALADGKVWIAEQRANGTWRNFEDLHATDAGPLAPVEHVAAAWADGTLQIMAVAGGKVWHTIRLADGRWQKWGDVFSVTGAIANPSQLSLSSTASGLEILTFSNGSLKHTVRNPVGGWQTWGNVFDMTGTLGGATRVSSAATGTGLEVMVLAGGKLWHTVRWPNTQWQTWGDVFSVTGTLASPSQVSVTATNAGLEVVALAGGTVHHAVRFPNTQWQPWGNVSQAVGQLNQPLSAAVVASGGDLKLVVAAGGAVNYTKRSSVTNGWSAWTQLTQTVENQSTDQTQRSYTYPAPGGTRPHALSRVDTTGIGARTETFTYDAAGNTVRRVTLDGDQALEWDAEGHLAKSTIAGKDTTFLYDADGNRLLRRDPDAVTLYLDGQELKLTRATQQVSGTRYVVAGAITIVKGSDGSLNYLIPDQQGTAQTTIDANTMAYTRGDTTPFGTPRGAKPAKWPTERGFVGGTADPTTGLTHLGAREYDPANGRFISVDPILDLADPQQINGYAYSNNDPVNLSDPSGLIVTDCKEGRCDGHHNPKGPADANVVNRNYDVEQAKSTKPIVLEGGIEIDPGMEQKKLGAFLSAWRDEKAKEDNRLSKGDLVGVMNYGWAAHNACVRVKCGSSMETDLIEQNFELGLEAGEIGGYGRDGGGPKKPKTKKGKSSKPGEACDLLGGDSFPPDTLVLMADGSTKKIGDIKQGDTVLATDPVTGTTLGKVVTAKIVTPDDVEFTELTIDAQEQPADSESAKLISTAHHPYWDQTTQLWTVAADLQVGDKLLTADGNTPIIRATRTYRTQPQEAHNLTVADLHTYYVLAGSTPVLVHNSNCLTMTSAIGDDPLLTKAAEQAGKNQAVQRDLDNLFKQLSQGNMNPGIGSKALAGTDVTYARGANGGRLFFRNVDGGIQIVGKSDKGNESKVIGRLMQLYGQ